MFFFNFNTKAMTDQELLDKTVEVNKKLAYAQRFSQDGNLVDSLMQMAEACAFESQERANQQVYNLMNANKPVEKDLTPNSNIKVSKTNGKQSTDSVKREGVMRVMRSSRPVKE
jgi:hypothetical protein